jgi:Flp pilus assembly protein TadG
MKRSRKSHQRGNGLVEFVLVAPWFFFLFVGVTQAGFAIYGLIAVQNAARVAALHLAANPVAATDQAGACSLVIQELKGLPNIGSSFSSNCNSSPVIVTVTYCDNHTPCNGVTTSVDDGPAAFVSVTYYPPAMAQQPIGGMSSITRTMEMRLRDPLP